MKTQLTVEKIAELLKKQKQELKKELSVDIDNKIKHATGVLKTGFNQKLEYVKNNLKMDSEEKFEQTKTELKSQTAIFKDEIIGRLDKIDQNLELIKVDKEQLEDHEARIIKLEKRYLTP